jgi:hypothetical protein
MHKLLVSSIEGGIRNALISFVGQNDISFVCLLTNGTIEVILWLLFVGHRRLDHVGSIVEQNGVICHYKLK